MTDYITDLETLELQAARIPLPAMPEMQQAAEALVSSPVAGFRSFSSCEVQLVGQYRTFVSRGSLDVVWKGIVKGDWNAWLYAVHEASELQAFADLGVNPFDLDSFERDLSEAHLRATISELQYSRRWAAQIGLDLSEIAIEIVNPMRSLFPPAHRKLIHALQVREGWADPTAEQMQLGNEFWRSIRGER